MDFDYFIEQRVNAQLSVDNIGNCVIVADNDIGEEWYLITRTIMGTTELVEYGPFDLSANGQSVYELPEDVNYTYSRFDYSPKKIGKKIDLFLNNPKRNITQARECELDEIKDNISNFVIKLQKEDDYEQRNKN